MTLRDNIGTFAKEDEAFDLLTRMSWQLPIFFIASAIVDLILAFVYLKWLHPWKIILQEVCVNSFLLQYLTQFSKEPESWKSLNEQNPILEKVGLF